MRRPSKLWLRIWPAFFSLFVVVAPSAQAQNPTPQLVSLFCEVHEISKQAKTDVSLLRFIFDSEKHPEARDARKSLMDHQVWLADGSSIQISEMDVINEPISSWLPNFLQKMLATDTRPRHYVMSISMAASSKMPTEVAHIPLESFATEKGQPALFELGSGLKAGTELWLRCVNYK